ncbi:hypothetical protein EST38_g1955 [Candolleomyces aberdarensis]|uniref:Protein kinase regulator n=1 Tax=Candolleomyces aberdarensis TaxID=2316362 RepID=A0A4Q2DUU9_9AGAR|nr:hypothetical protein EST38_g1955 [Candolleomyces aberdarensis]
MEGPAADRDIRDWDEADVHSWLSFLGYPHYEGQIREHSIRGDTLCAITSDDLRNLGISAIGQRLSILKAIYLVKVAHSVPIEESDYIPPSEIAERSQDVTVDKLHLLVKDQANRLRFLEEENRTLNTTLQTFLDEFNAVKASLNPQDDSPSLRRQPSLKWAQFVQPQKSPTKADVTAVETPHSSPQRLEHDVSKYTGQPPSQQYGQLDKPRPPHLNLQEPPTVEQPTLKNTKESSDNLKGFKVTLEDPTWKVLPAALKKYRINNDTWQNYAMFICYGSPGNRIERCLSYDEKPLLLFQKLKDSKKNPVFMLKHIKDIRSPIAVAQQKQAARKASSVISADTAITSATQGHQKGLSVSRNNHRPPKLEVQDLSATTPLPSNGLSPHPGGWPDAAAVSPLPGDNHHSRGTDESSTLTPATAAALSTHSSGYSSGATLVGNDSGKYRSTNDSGEPTLGVSGREIPPPNPNGISYAVAIYPYMAEMEDEFDVVVGDTFIILSRARGWWVVQRDPSGSGVVDPDTVKQGWVPAGCLLETRVPVASAIAEAASKGSSGSKTPILPLSIISTSFPGIALMDYKKKGEEELDLVKDDALRVFKRYNHWSYAVKEVGGDRGWVPSWFIGKVSATGVVPQTPNSSGINPLSTMSEETLGQTQISPMSSAFPAVSSSQRVNVV